MSGRIFCVAGYRILIIFFSSIANIFWEKYIFSLVSCHKRGFCSPTTVNNCTFAFSSKGKFLAFLSVDLAAYLAGYPAFSITEYPACHTQFPTGYPVHSSQLASSQPCRQRQHVVKSISKPDQVILISFYQERDFSKLQNLHWFYLSPSEGFRQPATAFAISVHVVPVPTYCSMIVDTVTVETLGSLVRSVLTKNSSLANYPSVIKFDQRDGVKRFSVPFLVY